MAITPLSLLTLNAGLPSVRLRNTTLYAPVPHVDERAAALPAAIMGIGADVVALQEVFEPARRAALAKSLRHRYPYAAVHDTPCLGLGHGLLTLSAFPILRSRFIEFSQVLLDDMLFVMKGFIATTIATPNGDALVINLHTTAGGLFRHPERRSVNEVRQGQVNQVLHACQNARADRIVLAGDLNAGPEASCDNYRSVLAAGYADAHAETTHDDLDPVVTWEPTNALNAAGPHRKCPPQRIDHVFVRGAARTPAVLESSIVLHAPMVQVPSGRVTVSDHFGFCARVA